MPQVKWLSLSGWAVLILREIREARKEVREAMATLQDEVTALNATLDSIATSLGVLGTDVNNIGTAQAALVQEIATLNANNPTVDLSGTQAKAQAVLDQLNGVVTTAGNIQAVATPTAAPAAGP
jgi:phage shock protein A